MAELIPPTIPPAQPDRTLPRVLIIDDSPEVLHDLRQLLDLSGSLVVVGEGHDGQEALQLAASLSPDVVVMDLEMPIMNGAEAARRIKENKLARWVVILSVHSSPEVMQLAREAGADRFVTKGAGYEILLNAILGKDGPTQSKAKGDGS